MFSLALILALAVPAFAESVQVTDFAGLNNSVDPAIIGQGETPDALNVELNRQGKGIRKRDGIVGFLTGYSTYTTTSLFAFKNQSGNEVVLFTNGPHVFRSINNATPVALTTVTADARLYCSNSQGTAYCFTSSNDVPWKCDGTTRTDLKTLSYPNGKFNVFTQDRQLVAGTTDQLNRLHISKSASFEDYSGGSDIVSSWTEDIGTAGDRITFLGYLNGRVIVGKEFSIVGFNLTDQFNSVMYGISSDVGLIGPESAIQRDGVIYFKGSDQDFYAIDGSPGGIDKLSVAISSTVASLLAGKTRYNIQTDKADWDAGNLTAAGAGAPMRTDIVVGSVIPSSITLVDTSSVNFYGGLIDKTGASWAGDLSFEAVTSTYSFRYEATALPENDGWTKSTSGGTPTTGVSGSSLTISGTGNVTYTRAITADNAATLMLVRFKADHTTGGSGGSVAFTLLSGGNNAARIITNGDDVQYQASGTTLKTETDVATDFSTYTVVFTTAPASYFWRNGTFIASATASGASSGSPASSARVAFGDADSGTFYTWVDSIYVSTGAPQPSTNTIPSMSTFTSRIFDTGFSTNVIGVVVFSTSLPVGTNLSFNIRSSSSPNNDFWGDYETINNSSKPTKYMKQYVQYRATMTHLNLSESPGIQDFTLVSATTGQYITQCIEPGSGISAWGAYEASFVADPGASIAHEIQTGTDCSSLGSFSAISTGTTIPGGVANALKIRHTFSLPAATSTARLDSLTVNWTEGAVASATYGAYWNNGLYWSVQTSTGGNNYVLKYDLLHPSWWLFDLKAGPILTFNNQLLMGSALPLGKVYKYSNTNPRLAPSSDDGSNINAYWKSKNFSGSDPFVENLYDGVNLILRKESGGTVTSTWQANGGDTGSGSYSISLSTGTNAVRSNYKVPIGTRGTFFNVKVSNNSTSPFEILGLRIDYKPQPYRPLP